MNPHILAKEVQDYIDGNLNIDSGKIALSKSPFAKVSTAELANQIAAKKKSEKKLPTWFHHQNIYYPSTLSIEQTSSEETAAYKQELVKDGDLIDVTAGFGVDSFYFSKKASTVYACEINPDLSRISAHNLKVLGAGNINCLAVDGIEYVTLSEQPFDTVYVDPARRNTSGKVFKLVDCTPNVVENLDKLLAKTERIIIKTSPLLDLQAGFSELKQVSQIHIVSVKNECKELLWIIDRGFDGTPSLTCVSLHGNVKKITLPFRDDNALSYVQDIESQGYLYEPDAALMKSGAFNAIGNYFILSKLDKQSHLYFSKDIQAAFIGRIFQIETVLSPNELKREKDLRGNVVVRNFPDKAENLLKKFKFKPDMEIFYIFTQVQQKHMVLKTRIIQYY